ncbi:MAG TPA: hypothetical protein VE131_12700 [Terriglobales bacterium]|nr:hypothetical protein [Terriglobales bacterium]
MAVSQKQSAVEETCRRFATIAVSKGFITAEQAKTALSEQLDEDLANKRHRLVGAILLEKGWITIPQIDSVLHELFPKAY